MLADTFIGAVGACGKCLDDGDVDAFLINKVTGIAEEKVESLSQNIERISAETITTLTADVEAKIQQIVQAFEADDTPGLTG